MRPTDTNKLFVIIFWVCIILPISITGQEICDNGIDDDFDNLIDLNDEDCACEIIETVSLISNPSFEETNCCPDDRSQLNCATDWIQASEPTTDFIHQCDWMGWDQFPPPLPFPDGQGIMGFRDGRVRNGEHQPFWKEYAGACLLSPMQADSNYRIQFDVGFIDPASSPPINISFFGTTSCDFLPFGIGNDNFGCPSNSPNWKKLGEASLSGGSGNTWVNSFIEIVPDEDIYAIAIGPDCPIVPSDVSTFYFFDNLILANLENFALLISETTHPCDADYSLTVPFNPDFEYQWYLEGVALVGEDQAELSQNYGEGIYQVRIDDGTTCKLSAAFEYAIPVFNAPISESICFGDTYTFGDSLLTEPGFYIDTFQNENGCDSIVHLELNVIGQILDTLAISILEGESYIINNEQYVNEGEYTLTLTSSLDCDSLVLLDLSHFNVYIPNVFSPNFDGINDIFEPLLPIKEIENLNLKIFNRWGDMLYQGTAWDGINYDPGVFVYLIEIDFAYGGSKTYTGTITLVR